MYPLITIGSLQLSSFSLMLALAVLAAALIGVRQVHFLKQDPNIVWSLLPWATVSGVIGSQLYAVLIRIVSGVDLSTALAKPGRVFYGALIAGAAVTAWRFRRTGLPLAWLFDYGVACIAIAHAIGRVGCFLVGDDYGTPTSLPWGVAFPLGTPPSTAGYLRRMGVEVGADVPASTVLAVHPVQLYEAAVLTLLGLWLWRASHRPHRPYAVLAAYAVGYGSWRFLIEFWRPKNDHVLGVLTSAQCISIVFVVVGVLALARGRGLPRPAVPPV